MSFHPAGGTGTEVGVPPPPPGPGVAPPFAAPPADRSRRALWIGLGVGGALLLLCCVGGLFGIGVLVVSTTEEAKRQASKVVTVYLDALRAGDYRTAHAQYCDSLADDVSREELAAQARREPFSDYSLDEPRFIEYIEVTARLLTSGGERRRTFLVDTAGGQDLKICGIR
jgi:hypothetical protein